MAQARPADGILGEEGGGSEGTSGLTWIVDPLDGTVNFLFAIPQWCVSVAVADDSGSLVGAIYDPCREELFSATRDGEARLNGDLIAASERAPRASADLAGAMVATGFAYDSSVRAAQAEVLARLIPRVRDIRRFGSAALDLAWAACGRYDAYFERTTKPWDIAAGTLVCERAGLTVMELPERERLPLGVFAAVPGIAERAVRACGLRRSAPIEPMRRVGSFPPNRDPRLGRGRGGVYEDAAGGNRTHTPFRTMPFESIASTVPPPPQRTSIYA